MAQRLINPKDSISVRSDKHSDRGTSIADRLFPDVRNATGHLLDALDKQGK